MSASSMKLTFLLWNALQTHQFDHFQGLLRRLARYGDRVHIVVDERLRAHPRMHFAVLAAGPGRSDWFPVQL
jgi:hypothetical protein